MIGAVLVAPDQVPDVFTHVLIGAVVAHLRGDELTERPCHTHVQVQRSGHGSPRTVHILGNILYGTRTARTKSPRGGGWAARGSLGALIRGRPTRAKRGGRAARGRAGRGMGPAGQGAGHASPLPAHRRIVLAVGRHPASDPDRKSTRLNSSH